VNQPMPIRQSIEWTDRGRARQLRWIGAIAIVLVAATATAKPVNELSVAAGIDSAYDDNVFNGRGPDFVNRIAPRASWRLIDPRVKAAAEYDLGVWTYAFGKASNSINHRIAASVEGTPTRRLTLKIGDEFVRAEDPGFLTRIAVVAPQIGIIDNTLDALAGYAIARRVYGDVAYTWHHAQFDPYTATQIAAGLPTLYNGDEHDFNALGDVRVTRTDDFRFAGRAQIFTAGPQDVAGQASLNTSSWRWRQGASYSPAVGWRHRFLRELELIADVGPIFYDRLAGSEHIPGAPPSGWTWRLASNLRWYTPTWRASISYAHDLLGATGVGSAVWADYAYAQAGYHFGEKLDVHVGGGYFRNGVAVNQPFSYDGFTVDTMVDWRVLQYLRVGAYYTLRWQRTGPGAVPPGAALAPFPNVTLDIVGVRMLAVLGADAKPPRREVKE
jgi:hypothetical protein